MIKFGITPTILIFKDKFYKYNEKVEGMKKGLTVGGFESDWRVDLMMDFLLEYPMTNAHFDDTHFVGIYQGDGIIISK